MLGSIDQSSRQQLAAINELYSNNRNNEQFDPDSLMVWAKSRHLLSRTNEVLNVLNQVGIFDISPLPFQFKCLIVVNRCTFVYTFLLIDYCHISVVPAGSGG